MKVLVQFGTGYDNTQFGVEVDNRITVLPGLISRYKRNELMREHGCTGFREELRPAPRSAQYA